MDQIPSGKQFPIASGGTNATVVQVGGALRTLEVGGRPLLDGYPAEAICDGARGQFLLPWPNRVRDGHYRWRGTEYQLGLTEPTNSCAIHGLVRWANWECAEQRANSVSMTYRMPPQPEWPWALDLSLTYTVEETGITVRTTARNLSDAVAPFAAGAHPYLCAGTDIIDDARVHIPAASWLPTDPQQIPTGVEPVDGSPYDFRTPRRLGDTAIDYAYTDLERDSAGIFRAQLAGSWTTEIWLDESFRYLEVFTGDALPNAARRRQGLGVEPMTAPPNALASGTDIIALRPGEAWTGTWGIRYVE
ncbi:MAG: aldose 1-epimerase family protein [Frankiaceae bacterium]